MKIFQPIVSGSFTTSGSVFLKGLTSAAQSNVILIDTASGQLYTTASSALGGQLVATASFATTSSNVLGGTANYIPLWNTNTSLSSSVLYQSASNIGIGSTAPTSPIHVYRPTTGVAATRVGLYLADANIAIANSSNFLLFGRFDDIGTYGGFTSGIRNVNLGNNAYEQGLTFHTATAGVGAYNSPAASEVMRLTNLKNVLINTTTDNGGKLQIVAPGTAATDVALRVRNNANTGDLFGTQGDGMSFVDSATDNASLIFKNAGVERFRIQQNSATLKFSGPSTSIGGYSFTAQLNSDGRNNASLMSINPPTINFSSGTNLYRPLGIYYTINTTGGTNTITGLRIDGTLTSVTGTTHRAIETTTGDVIFGSTSGNVGIRTTTPSASLHVQGTVMISQSLFQYSNNAAILSGSTADIASFSTSSYMAGFFDFVASSGLNARAGTIFTVWNGASLEYVETSTNDIGSTTNLILSASLLNGNVRLQGTSLSGTWNVKTLTRMI